MTGDGRGLEGESVSVTITRGERSETVRGRVTDESDGVTVQFETGESVTIRDGRAFSPDGGLLASDVTVTPCPGGANGATDGSSWDPEPATLRDGERPDVDAHARRNAELVRSGREALDGESSP